MARLQVGDQVVRDRRRGESYTILEPPGGGGGADATVYAANSVCYMAAPPRRIVDVERVFLKHPLAPAPDCEWFNAYIRYQTRLKGIIDSDENLQTLTYRLYDFFKDDHELKGKYDRAQYWQAIEWVEGGRDLKKHLESSSLTDSQRVTFSKLLMYSIQQFHDAGIVHCDLKPENVMLFETTAKVGYNLRIVDFDRSLIEGEEAPWKGYEGYAGTMWYMSPEHAKGQRPVAASDVFTCGIMLYELLCRKEAEAAFPDDGTGEDGYKARIQRRGAAKRPALRIRKGTAADERLEEMLYACLDPDPRRRPTAGDVHKALLAWDMGTTANPKRVPTGRGRTIAVRSPCTPAPDPRGGPLTLRAVGGEFEMSVGPMRLPPVDGFGKNAARSLFDDEARFFAAKQFGLERDRDGHWYVVPNEAAANATLYNWKRVTGKIRITTGGILAVGSRDPTKKVAKGIMEVYVQGESPIRVPRRPPW